MWGTGDAAAALIGVPFGKHKVRCRGTDGKKSWEGSAAMLVVSFLCGCGTLLFAQRMAMPPALCAAGAAALVGTAVELFSSSELDTVTVPACVAAVLMLFMNFFG